MSSGLARVRPCLKTTTTQPPNSPKQNNNNNNRKEDSDSFYPLLESAVLETEPGAWHMRGHAHSR